MLVHHSGAFVADYFTFNLIGRSITTAPGDSAAPSFYLSSLEEAFGLWSALVPFAIVLNRSALAPDRPGRHTPILLVAVGVIFAAFTLAESKLEWYIMPLYPPLCILLADILVMAWKSARTFAFAAVAYSLVLAFLAAKTGERLYLAPILLLAIIGLLIAPRLRRRLESWADVVHEQGARWLRLPARWTKAILASSASQPALAIRLGKLLVGVSIAFFVTASFSRAADAYTIQPSPVADLAEVAARSTSSAPIVCVNFHQGSEDVVGFTTLFYSGRRVIAVVSPEELASYMAGVSGAEIMLHRSRMEALSADYDFHILATSDGFVYAIVQRKPG
jgi:4-amino-4-deoxy-L-arabinose transferase-like glycosyltransferase